jgi:hypothetical protein
MKSQEAHFVTAVASNAKGIQIIDDDAYKKNGNSTYIRTRKRGTVNYLLKGIRKIYNIMRGCWSNEMW